MILKQVNRSIIYTIFTSVTSCYLLFMFLEFFYNIMEILIYPSCRYQIHENMKISTCRRKINTMEVSGMVKIIYTSQILFFKQSYKVK